MISADMIRTVAATFNAEFANEIGDAIDKGTPYVDVRVSAYPDNDQVIRVTITPGVDSDIGFIAASDPVVLKINRRSNRQGVVYTARRNSEVKSIVNSYDVKAHYVKVSV